VTPHDAVRVAIVVEVPPDEAFELFTRDVDAWWRRGPRYRADGRRPSTMRFEPGKGGRLLEIYDESRGELFEFGKVLDWDPPARLAFEFRGTNFAPGESTRVEVRFEPDADGTRVTLEQSGFAALRPDHPVRHGEAAPAFVASMGRWWSELLVALRGATSRARPPR
jgi:uncharacterized protein YndB with AHSA1/START domain